MISLVAGGSENVAAPLDPAFTKAQIRLLNQSADTAVLLLTVMSPG